MEVNTFPVSTHTVYMSSVEIALSNGGFMRVSPEQEVLARTIRWRGVQSPSGTKYAVGRVRIPGRSRLFFAHRLFTNAQPFDVTDHKDGDGLNNCLWNLQLGTNADNARGFRRKARGSTSIFRGVSWDGKTNKWKAAITFNGETIYLGSHADETNAGLMWCLSAEILFGADAKQEFVRQHASAPAVESWDEYAKLPLGAVYRRKGMPPGTYRTKRFQIPVVEDLEAYLSTPVGSVFQDSSGNTFVKSEIPKVGSEESFWDLPKGSYCRDETGKLFQRPFESQSPLSEESFWVGSRELNRVSLSATPNTLNVGLE